MAKQRVYDLAKELGVANKDILAALELAGMAVKSHSSTLGDDQIKVLNDKFKPKPSKKKPEKGEQEVVQISVSTKSPAKPGSIKTAPTARKENIPFMPPAAKRVTAVKAAQKAEESEKRHKPVVQEKPDRVMTKPAPHKPVEEVEAAETAVPKAVEAEVAETVVVEAPVAPVLPEAPAPAPAEAPVEAPVEAHAEAPAAPKAEPVEEKAAPSVVEAPAPVPEVPEPVRPREPEAVIVPPVKEQPASPAAPGAAVKEAPGKPKKPHPKGPKPIRPEIEVLEGVERLPVIPAKLKNRLQPVIIKKPKAPDAEQVKKEGRKWQDFKTIGKKKGKFRQPMRQENVEDTTGVIARKRAIKVTEGLTVKDFSDKIGVKVGEVLKKLMEMGTMATINQPMDQDAAVLIADSFGLKLDVTPITDEEAFVEEALDRDEDLLPRPPVVTIMGHVDHGKTSLLDSIRKTNVTGAEAGGITQHIGAYKVRLKDKDIVFLDTPGHEAFTAMRARGAQVTDIVVLVVAADDGVRPQTIEAINHAKAAKVPIIVAVNKIDKPEADLEKVKRELSDQGLVPEEWGGDVIFAPVSAKKQIGLEALLEMILLQAEVMELKANPNKHGRGTIIEAKLDKGRGPVATVLVATGTIKGGDAFVTGQHYGRIRMLLNDRGKKEKEAGPATPVEVIGLSGVPQAGDSFVVMEDEKKARQVAQSRMQKLREVELAKRKRVTLDDLFSQIQQGAVKELNIIIKADVQGSVEAVAESLVKLSTDAVKLNVIHGSVGAITESDIMLASASNAIIIGFNIRPEPKATSLAEAEGVDIRLYNIIYNAIDEVRAAMEGLLEPTLKEKVLGRAEVRQTFSVPKIGLVAGSYVLDGVITRGCAGVRVLRDNVVVYQGKLSSLRRFKDDVKEVLTGYECGIGIENFNDLKVGDVIEAYDIESFAGKL